MIRQGTYLSNRYEILSQIGSGGMSDVYKAKCHLLNREVAIKVLKKEFSEDINFVTKFRLEAQNAAKLSHPNIVGIYDVGEDNGVYFIVMELIRGITLKKYIERKKKLDIREAIEVAMQVARGIEAAHSKNIVHRDIKPQNIMISMEGKVKVTDFGIAKAVTTQTLTSNSMGSVHYISPEQARGGYLDAKSDIYSLGITFYEMLTGRVPFDGDNTVSVALQHIQADMVPPRQYEPLIPVSLEKIVLKCCQKKPEMRYQSATELIEDLKKALTMPNEDFVRMPVLPVDSPTTVISPEEFGEIRRRKSSSDSAYYDDRRREPEPEEYDDYDDYDDYDEPRGKRRRREYEDYDDYDEEGSAEEDRPLGIRFATGASLAAAFIIIVVALVLLMKGCADPGSHVESSSGVESSEAEQVPMVNLLGKSRGEATELLTRMKLRYAIETGTSDDYEEGTVFEQQYKEGEMLDVGTEVLIRISLGSGSVVIPTGLNGKSVNEATAILTNAGITVASKIIEQPSESVEKGQVINTDPAMGVSINKQETVSLIVSSGPSIVMVTVPNLSGLTEDKAGSRLKELNLVVGQTTAQEDDHVKEGCVISQSIPAGTSVEEGTTVDLVISSGSTLVTVPDVLYDSLSEAKNAIKARGLSVGSVREEYSDDITRGLVISQSIRAGQEVEKGTAVDLTVSKGAEPEESSTEAPTSAPTDAPDAPSHEGDDSGDDSGDE